MGEGWEPRRLKKEKRKAKRGNGREKQASGAKDRLRGKTAVDIVVF